MVRPTELPGGARPSVVGLTISLAALRGAAIRRIGGTLPDLRDIPQSLRNRAIHCPDRRRTFLRRRACPVP